jgi:thiamine pyrophosphokinase
MTSHLPLCLIANGSCELSHEQIEYLKKTPYLIAVDGGLKHCHRLGLKPTIYVGDFDSTSQEDLDRFPKIETHLFSEEKDQSDLELALDIAFKMSSGPLHVYAALGGRTDHSLYNLVLLSRFPGRLEYRTKNERVFALGKENTMKTLPGQTLSLLPINGPAQGVTTRGLKWELHDATLDKRFLSLSNICLDKEISISVSQGDLLCFMEASP